VKICGNADPSSTHVKCLLNTSLRKMRIVKKRRKERKDTLVMTNSAVFYLIKCKCTTTFAPVQLKSEIEGEFIKKRILLLIKAGQTYLFLRPI
jgi:hypothetical protein